LKPHRSTLARLMLYAAKCYWPGITESELDRVAERADLSSSAGEAEGAAYLGALLFEADDLVICLFEARSRSAVSQASEQLGIPCERVMTPVWLAAHRSTFWSGLIQSPRRRT
jgi:hypothetical protein